MDIDLNKIRRLDLTLLLIFRDLVRQGRTTKVAAGLGLSQSAVSHALTRLRDLFEDPLFIRRPNGLEPTMRALELQPTIEALIDLAHVAVSRAGSFDPAAARRVFRLSGNDLIASIVAAPLIDDLRRTAPGTRLVLRQAVGAQSLDALRRNEIDLALGTLWNVPDGFDVTPLLREDFVVVARRGHPGLAGAMSLEAYLALDHLLVSYSGGFTGLADQALARLGLARRVPVSVPGFFAALAAAAESDLVATLPRRLAAKHAARFGLETFPVPFEIPPFEVVAVRHARARHDPALDWLMGRIVATV